MQPKLTVQERLKDLRSERKLTLEMLAEQIGISKSALGKYEADDFKDISPFSIVTLAKFYVVSTDYLLGITENKNHPNTELEALHLSDDAVEVLKNGKFNHRLLSEMIFHENFQRLMVDMEIYADRIADMGIQNFNSILDAVRLRVIQEYDPDENDLHLRTLEVGQIDETKYFSQIVHDDIDSIMRTIRDKHRTDSMTADEDTTIEEIKKQINEAVEFKGSSQEQQIRMYLATLGIDYDSLTQEEFIHQINILKKSKLLKNPTSQRGKALPYQPHGQGKRKRK